MSKWTGKSILSFFFAVGILSAVPIMSDFVYTAVSEKYLKPYSIYSIATTLEKVDDSPVTFNFQITSMQNERIASKEVTLSPESRFFVAELEIGDLPDVNYNLTVNASDENKTFKDSVVLVKNQRNSSILIQTDKPIYKPGETVNFRVFVLNRYLQPFRSDKNITLTISDPRRNLIKLIKSISVPGLKGFISDKFELSVEPNLGVWTMQAVLDSNTLEKCSYPFSVDQYVLPKFKVGIKLHPSYVTFNESDVKVVVSAIHTYGKPVQGECTLVLKKRLHRIFRSRPRNKQVKIVSKTVQLEQDSGTAFVHFDLKSELDISRQEVDVEGKNFEINVSCKDKVSGQIRNESSSIKMYKYDYKIEMVCSVEKITPGFPFNVRIKVATQDNIPVGDSEANRLKIENKYSNGSEIMEISVPPTGVVVVAIPSTVTSTSHYRHTDVTFKQLTQRLRIPEKKYSQTGSFLQLTLNSANLREGEDAEINVRTSKPVTALNILLISRGIVLTSNRVEIFGEKDYDLKVILPHHSAPKAKLVIYAIFPDEGQIIVDTLKLDIQMDKKDELEISLSDEIVEPSGNVSIYLKGRPNSIIGLTAVDQSVLLLKNDNEFTHEKLRSVGDYFDREDAGYVSHYGGSTAYGIFTRLGLTILTNGKFEEFESPLPEEHIRSSRISGIRGISLSITAAGLGHARSPEEYMQPARIRYLFPETWFWEEIEAPEGNTTLEKVVPDTITSWIINGFQINSEKGLALSGQTQKLTVFRPFFISLNLPYSIVKGEVLGLQVIVHNYLDESLVAKVTLDNKDNFFKFLEDETAQTLTKKVTLNASAISSVTFPIFPMKFGSMTLNVKAVTKIAGDAVSRSLKVKPPGVKYTKNSAVLINFPSGNNSSSQKLTAVFPEGRVPKADFLKFSVVGDILGGTIENLDKLIRLPCGCGEQNMLHFVPDIVILDYLKVTGGLTPEIETKAIRFLEKGYQQELTYKRQDGSFSAFGKSDREGSTWLTAFVTRAFIAARKYITVDDKVIKNSLKFLVGQQTKKGSFVEKGRVHDKSLQGGGASTQFALTAFTLLTFIEADKAKSYNDSVIKKGVEFLIQSTLEGELKEPYGVNLIAYLLHVIDHPKKNHYFQMVEYLSTIDQENNMKHWERIQQSNEWKLHESLEPTVKPATVEMTSYALLTYLLRGKRQLPDSLSIARWLMNQRNAQGGFISTQDTIVGITALANFAQALNPDGHLEPEMNIKLSWGSNHSYDFYIGQDNQRMVQEYFLPKSVRDVQLAASGNGTALAQLSWTYYIEAKDTSPAFKLDINVTDVDKGKQLEMNACVSYIRSGDSNMAILEGNAPSGYTFDRDQMEELRKSNVFTRYEIEEKESKVNLYFNALDSKEVCFDLNANRVFDVANHTKGHVLIYDYYDTTQRAQGFYIPPPVPLFCDLCNLDNSCEINNCA